MRTHPLPLVGLLALAACGPTKETVQTPLPPQTAMPDSVREVVLLESPTEVVDTANYRLSPYRAAEARPWDLTHTKLRVRFDWPNEQVIGQATLSLKPTFRPRNELVLDAKGFEVKQVTLGENSGRTLPYRNTDSTLVIDLGRDYQRGEEAKIYIDYVATPAESGMSGAAITSDKGLFFINPKGDEDKPQQIWTQGETEHNSRWFPTIDQPNERATQEFYITVQDKYETLSNGVLVSSNPAAGGMRTDYWRMDKPHAPYLHMIAVGEYAKVDDRWRNVPLSYYVEEDYREDAEEIFAHTPEMLDFFSELTGVDYPWPKYAQIVVRDYVSGAMENTTAVVFGEQVQRHERELADDNNDLIVAHEMFHHWFGDYVTTESWANLTLNEGFANYSEYLWFEHHDGKAAAEDHRLNELQGYLGSGEQGGFHPLIWYQHRRANGEDMFDGHSYNKGGLVLHMLRDYVGDEAFFASLKRYLVDNALTAVEVDELRMAFEDTVGEDLQWFFDQWFIGNGHPEYSVDYGYADGMATVSVTQTQDVGEFRPVFKLVTQVVQYPAAGGDPIVHDVVVDERREVLSFDAQRGDLFVFDPNSVILGDVTEERTTAEQLDIFQREGIGQRKRLFAIRALRAAAEQENYAVPQAVVNAALNAESFRVANNGIALVDVNNPTAVASLRRLAREGTDVSVRSGALAKLAETGDASLEELYREVLSQDQSYGVMSSGLQGLFKMNPTAGLEEAKKLEASESVDLLTGVAAIYAELGAEENLGFFERRLADVDYQQAGEFAGAYLGLALKNGPAAVKTAVNNLAESVLAEKSSLWRRYAFTAALAELKGVAGSPGLQQMLGGEDLAPLLTEKISAIKAAETNPQLIGAFEAM